MAKQVSKSIFDCSHLKMVPVIASFNAAGDINPLYIKADGVELKILSCVIHEDCNAYISYHVIVQDDLYEKHISVLYFKREHAWAIELNKR